MKLTVEVGHLESNQTTLPRVKEAPAPLPSLFGMALTDLTAAERKKHNLGDHVEGVVVHQVASESLAAAKGIVPGMVIVEINQEIVSTPDAVMSRIEALKDAGKSTIVFLLARPDGGELVFVPIKME